MSTANQKKMSGEALEKLLQKTIKDQRSIYDAWLARCENIVEERALMVRSNLATHNLAQPTSVGPGLAA